MSRWARRVVFGGGLAVFGLLVLAWLAAGWITLPVRSLPATIDIPRGSGIRGALEAIHAAEIGVPDTPFMALLWATGGGRRLRAGLFDIDQAPTLLELARRLISGPVRLREVTFPEGWSARQVRGALQSAAGLTHDAQALDDDELAGRLGLEGGHLEGWVFPSTYRFPSGTGELEIYRLAVRRMQQELALAWGHREAGNPLRTPYDALILASIVEKETALESDRPRIAQVFLNRLRRSMPLQSDPTTIYGLAHFDGNLRRRDLFDPHPWNTYMHAGLPPTPIAMPSRASLEAVVRAPRGDELYFVARGDGSSEFSRDLADHNRAVARYQRPK